MSLFLDDYTLKLYYQADLLPFLKELTVQICQAFVYFIVCLKMMKNENLTFSKLPDDQHLKIPLIYQLLDQTIFLLTILIIMNLMR